MSIPGPGNQDRGELHKSLNRAGEFHSSSLADATDRNLTACNPRKTNIQLAQFAD